jgi:hypothetical protein
VKLYFKPTTSNITTVAHDLLTCSLVKYPGWTVPSKQGKLGYHICDTGSHGRYIEIRVPATRRPRYGFLEMNAWDRDGSSQTVPEYQMALHENIQYAGSRCGRQCTVQLRRLLGESEKRRQWTAVTPMRARLRPDGERKV